MTSDPVQDVLVVLGLVLITVAIIVTNRIMGQRK